MQHRSIIESYSLEIIGRAQSGESRCKRLVAADFVSQSPKRLAETLLNIFSYLARVTSIVTNRINWEADADKIEKDVEVLRVLDWQIKEFAAHIRYVESARTDRLPWQAIPSFEKLVEYLRPGAHVMLRPMWHYNYATVVTNLRDLYQTELQEYEFYTPDTDIESKIILPLSPAFHIISFPALERDNILLHSVIGHELGHLVATDLAEAVAASFLADVRTQIELHTEEELVRAKVTADSNPMFYNQVRTKRIAENSERCLLYWSRAMEEIVADVLGAVLFGPAALFSTLDIAVQTGFDVPPSDDNEFYPPWRLRIREVMRVVDAVAPSTLSANAGLFRMPAPVALKSRAKELAITSNSRAESVNDRIATIREIAKATTDQAAVDQSPLAKIAYSTLRKYVDQCANDVKIVLADKVFKETQAKLLPALIERLDAGITPNSEHDMPSREPAKVTLVDVLNAAWYHKASLALAPISAEDRQGLEKVRDQRNRLTLKAIEYAHLAEEHPVTARRQPPTQASSGSSGVLTRDDIHDFMERPAILERVVVTPLLDPNESLGEAAVDVRLGSEFILFRKEAFDALDIASTSSRATNLARYQERVIRMVGHQFVLHPRQLVISSTLEYIQLPQNVMAYVVGKSTWGRTGLVIATATKVDPGFRGCITLEMINEGEVPVVLWPGMPIAQLVLHRTERAVEYGGIYTCPIGPEFPKFDTMVKKGGFWLRSVNSDTPDDDRN